MGQGTRAHKKEIEPTTKAEDEQNEITFSPPISVKFFFCVKRNMPGDEIMSNFRKCHVCVCRTKTSEPCKNVPCSQLMRYLSIFFFVPDNVKVSFS